MRLFYVSFYFYFFPVFALFHKIESAHAGNINTFIFGLKKSVTQKAKFIYQIIHFCRQLNNVTKKILYKLLQNFFKSSQTCTSSIIFKTEIYIILNL